MTQPPSSPGPDSLDLKCAEAAAAMAVGGDQKEVIGKALGVLQEDGVYAFFVYTLALKQDKARAVIEQADTVLRQCGLLTTQPLIDVQSLAATYKGLASDLERLFFAKEILERTLTYARYQARAYEPPRRTN